MNAHVHRLHDLFDGVEADDNEYHQDYREAFWTPLTRAGVQLPLLLFLAGLVYHILCVYDFDLLPLPELLWNCLVYLTPSRLLDVVETYTNPLRISNPASRRIHRTHAAKSEAMRRILGLDKNGGIISTVASAGRRRLSSIPGINMAALEQEGGPPGLGNWDNSCYQNSVLQGLASLDSLSGYLTNPNVDGDLVEGSTKPDMKMAEALRGLIATLNDPLNSGKRIWTPAVLKSMSSWQQQDAQEYFSKVLDEIDKEVGKVAKLMTASQGFKTQESSTPNSKSSELLPVSIFRNPLEGLIAQRVGCTQCGYSEGLSMIPFNCLTVPLGRSWEYDISECLDKYTKLEQIEGVECGKCTLLRFQHRLSIILDRAKDAPEDSPVRQATIERLEAVTSALEDDDYEEKTLLQKCKIPPKSRVSSTKSRQAVIARPPRSLVVHINRSLFDERTGELKKNYSEVRFPKILDLGPWCLGSSGAANDPVTEQWLLDPDQPMIASTGRPSRLRGPMYELRAVVTHYGRHENGHYICYKKRRSLGPDENGPVKEQWWRLSDEDVMKVSEENVLGLGGAFMLFFDFIEPAAAASSSPAAPPGEAPILAATAAEEAHPSELALAAGTPLPAVDDIDLSDSEDPVSITSTAPHEESSVATSLSESGDEDPDDDDDDNDNALPEYRPAKAILVSPCVNSNEAEAAVTTGQQGMMPPGSLVMV